MQLYSTNDLNRQVDLKEAVLKALPPDRGLYMPQVIPTLPSSFFDQLLDLTFVDLAEQVCQALFQGTIPTEALHQIVADTLTFDAPLVSLRDNLHVLELFHGPTMAFKDFGARFMARLMSYFNQGETRKLTILVATSGDTGGAVAAGFFDTPGIEIIILYPKGRVSFLQERQLTTWGKNITALEVAGSFDDCQAMVKTAFLDEELNAAYRLTSANSINIARLIPQSFYYYRAWQQLQDRNRPAVYCVPSGNFGNLTAGILAQRMGLPIHHFIAATNANDIVPTFLQTGKYEPRASVSTISNAMDVGNPSNFARMRNLFGEQTAEMRSQISGYAFDDEATTQAIQATSQQHGYTLDPHGAVGMLAAEAYLQDHPDSQVIVLGTAHPAKFPDPVSAATGKEVEIPPRLAAFAEKEKVATPMPATFTALQDWMLERAKTSQQG